MWKADVISTSLLGETFPPFFTSVDINIADTIIEIKEPLLLFQLPHILPTFLQEMCLAVRTLYCERSWEKTVVLKPGTFENFKSSV